MATGDEEVNAEAFAPRVERPGFIDRVAALVALDLAARRRGARRGQRVRELVRAGGVAARAADRGPRGWYVVSRRGTPRIVATGAAAVGAAVLLTGLLIADMSVLRIATAFVIVVLSIGSAGWPSTAPIVRCVVSPRTRVPVPPARHPVLLVNPRSGGGKAERFGLVDVCRERGIEAIVLRPGDDLLELAEAAVARGADVIGMAGGDGSQALVAGVASRHGVAHVVVPSGTRNHFALDLGLDRTDVLGALDAFHDGVERRIDLATVNGRVFVNNASMGLYAKIVQSPEYRDAKRGTVAGMLPELIGPNAPPMDLRFTGPTAPVTRRRTSSWCRTTRTSSAG